MNYWLLKTEPGSYSFDDLTHEGRAAWDGVRNPQALIFLRRMAPGDRTFIYHTGKEKQVVGLATVVTAAYPDPKAGDERFAVVDVEAGERLPRPVTLVEIKADDSMADFHLVRFSRLSVMPVPSAIARRIRKAGGL